MALIDTNVLMEDPVWKCGGDPYDPYYMGYQDALDNVEVTIENLPTVDAVEVVHGRWRKLKELPYASVYYCSICGKPEIRTSKYCPSCGADMRDGDGNESV